MNMSVRFSMHNNIRGCALALWLAGALAASAAVPGIITKAGSGQQIKGMIKWMPASKEFVVVPADNASLVMKFSPQDVASVQVLKKPDQYDAAVGMVKQGQYAQAIPLLQQIADEYAMLQYDVQAGFYLATAYLKMKDIRKAAEACDKIVSINPNAVLTPEFASVYWDCLLGVEQFAKLRELLTKAISEGDRNLAAVAQLKRGDMDKQKGNAKDALINGYLRTIVLFEANKDVQPEALYKAAKCFEEVGQVPYAEKMRKKLLTEYPDSEYAGLVKAGK
jgi:TolA-binding protein